MPSPPTLAPPDTTAPEGTSVSSKLAVIFALLLREPTIGPATRNSLRDFAILVTSVRDLELGQGCKDKATTPAPTTAYYCLHDDCTESVRSFGSQAAVDAHTHAVHAAGDQTLDDSLLTPPVNAADGPPVDSDGESDGERADNSDDSSCDEGSVNGSCLGDECDAGDIYDGLPRTPPDTLLGRVTWTGTVRDYYTSSQLRYNEGLDPGNYPCYVCDLPRLCCSCDMADFLAAIDFNEGVDDSWHGYFCRCFTCRPDLYSNNDCNDDGAVSNDLDLYVTGPDDDLDSDDCSWSSGHSL